ncbi:MAG: TyeA family type III secretion system gatekeeper subunit [Parvibaculaceae bacterium]|nr:TyeA family type III secretion system gatekeeper subunit [Parvibaculaceae bacterium]
MPEENSLIDDMAFIYLAKALAPDQTMLHAQQKIPGEPHPQLVYANELLFLLKQLPEGMFKDDERRSEIIYKAELACDVLAGHEMTMRVLKK